MICIPCGYIYEKNEQAFSTLAEDWCCPDCGADIKCFAKIDASLPEQVETIIDASEL